MMRMPTHDGYDTEGCRILRRGRVLGSAVLLLGALWSLMLPVRGSAADIEDGRRKAEVCASCHGANGHSIIPTMPSLAGQQPLYLFLQLIQFREKRRTDPQMSPFAERLSDDDIQDIAAYYAAQKPFASRRAGDPEKVPSGRTLAAAHHCASCHAPGLIGQNHIPRLVGQHFEYLLNQMRGFKAQTRADIDGSMTTAAQPLSGQDIENLADYIADLSATP